MNRGECAEKIEMNRIEFTRKKCELVLEMIAEGESPIEDYLKRSDKEQMHLFQESKSKCDGVKNRSAHQDGKAVDIYFVKGGKLVDPNKGWDYWHKKWEEKDGKPMIAWDKGHFEG